MIKILCACGNGMGSSMLIKIKVENIVKELGFNASVDTASISEAKSIVNGYDIVLCSTYLVSDLTHTKAKIIGLDNLLDGDAIKKALKDIF
ncbi:PTS sugar transporter subunit IIB [Spiroplasma endosymbiont of Aspidapion aeneum]|uniref:PTS sugar transporter subunit IIB n=1 Tax=Spiroplasma endosymbiont of Aspidapion aeneum TaxID=3066276 RepID=UPI00313ED582